MIGLNEKKRGFSLAEALITLTIIALVAVGSVPLLKKKKDITKIVPHGKWTCVRTASWQYTQRMTKDGSTTTTTSSNGCRFEPPEGAKNFAVKVVGAGGGGAAGTRPRPRMIYNSGSVRVDESGEYTLALVGGGGAGGGMRCGTITMGGGSGGWIVENVVLNKDASYYITVGNGGSGQGNDGTGSTFSGDQYSFNVTGGIGGNSRKDTAIDCRWTGDSGGRGGTPNGVNGSKGSPNALSTAGIISNSRLTAFTNGGNYGNGAAARNYYGSRGVASLTRVSLGSGGAGRPGEVIIKTYPTLQTVVGYPGWGGSGGSSSGDEGTSGGNTRFFDITAGGGIGGDPEYVVNRTANAPGQNASVPELTQTSTLTRSFGGYTENNNSIDATPTIMNVVNDGRPPNENFGNGAGSGGSGGGATTDLFGEGSMGMPGAIIIDW